VPVAALAAFIDEVRAAVATVEPHARTWLFGHVADGNIHVNITGADVASTTVDDTVFALVQRYGGSISAEHGIGTAKKPWLHLNRSSNEIETFRRIKKAFDPANILNPNVLLP
jgi:FAD/FMN-containing dehydrogenase